MSDLFKKFQKVYDRAGHEYFYIEKTDEGHYVRDVLLIQCINTRGDDFTEEEEDGPLRLVSEIFAEPPRAKMNADIEELGQKIRDLHLTVASLQRTKSGVEKEITQVKTDLVSELEKYPHHKTILQILEGKRPLFKVEEGGSIYKDPNVSTIVFDLDKMSIERHDPYNDCEDNRYFYDIQLARQAFTNTWHEDTNYADKNSWAISSIIDGFDMLGLRKPARLIAAIETSHQKELGMAEKALLEAQARVDKLNKL